MRTSCIHAHHLRVAVYDPIPFEIGQNISLSKTK